MFGRTWKLNITLTLIYHRIAQRPNLVKIIDNISWLILDKFLRMGVGLLVWIWIARYLGSEQFGLFSFVTAFVSLFSTIAGLGLQGIVVRDIVRDPSNKEETLGTAVMLQFIGGLLAYGLVLVGIFWLRPDDVVAKGLVAILGSMMLFKASEVTVYWFESQVLSKYTVWVQNGSFLIFAVVKVGLILNNAPLIAFAWAAMAEALLFALLMLVMLDLRGPRLRKLQISFARARLLLADSWPLLLSSIAIAIYMKIDQIMLGQMIGEEAVGIYSVAVRLSEIWYLIPSILVVSVFPSLANYYKKDRDFFYRALQKLCGLLVKLAILVAIVVTIFSGEIINLIFGPAYQGASDILVWHIWSGIFVFFGIAWSKWIVLEGKQKTATYLHLMSLVSNVILNLFLIPRYGAVGAAIATTISYSLGHTVFMYFFPSQKKAVILFWKSFGLTK